MFENIGTFFKKIIKTEPKQLTSKDAAKERLHLVLMQDRANVSVDFLELMKQEIIDVIKKYIEIDEKSIDVRLTNQANEDGTTGAPSLYANIPIVNIKNDVKSEKIEETAEIIEEASKIVQEQENISKEEVEKEVKIEEKVSTEDSKEEKEIDKNVEEVKENEEEIDDVPTFDELLKQSEEEVVKEESSKEEISKDIEVKIEKEKKPKTKKTTTSKGKTKKKTEEE